MPTKKANRENENKPDRIPVGGHRDIMTVYGKDESYEYRWVEDKSDAGSRILRFKRGGWEFVSADPRDSSGGVIVGEENVYSSEQNGSIVRLPTGGANYSYLMRIKKEWYDEDQVAKQDKIDMVEDAIRRTGTSEGEDFGQYGNVAISDR